MVVQTCRSVWVPTDAGTALGALCGGALAPRWWLAAPVAAAVLRGAVAVEDWWFGLDDDVVQDRRAAPLPVRPMACAVLVYIGKEVGLAVARGV